jgi:hypothetical protein
MRQNRGMTASRLEYLAHKAEAASDLTDWDKPLILAVFEKMNSFEPMKQRYDYLDDERHLIWLRASTGIFEDYLDYET